jgi:hypothetical protein
MIKIKLARDTAIYEGGTWKSDNKNLEDMLNEIIIPDMIPGYVPNIEQGIFNLVQDSLIGVEILEYDPVKPPKDSGEPKIY